MNPLVEGNAVQFNLKFVYRVAESTTSVTAASGSTDEESEKVVLQLNSHAPSISTCDTSSVYYPLDSAILLSTPRIVGTVGTAPISSIVMVGKNGGTPNASSTFRDSGNDVIGVVSADGGVHRVAGFLNTTDGVDRAYDLAFTVRDAAGIVANFSSCTLSGVRTSEISGFLSESQCFVASATYQSNSALPVILLRQFRDQILINHVIGRGLAKWYYRYSPVAAQWLLAHPEWRPPVLMAFVPILVFALLILNPWIYLSLIVLAGSVSFGLLKTSRAARDRK